MADAPGTQLGHYRLVAPIGTGGFATVYRAVDERLDAEVAVKVLAENHALDPEVRERFITEAQLLRRVSSGSIIQVHDVGETERDQPFIVLSYADRGDLRTRVEERRASGQWVTEHDAQLVASTLALALSRVHAAGLVHRDVKPANLLLCSQGGPPRRTGLMASGELLLLGDLGYAKDLVASSGLTVGGGTDGFNAPEQRVGLGRVDSRADIYGASAVIHWLLTGSTPSEEAAAQGAALGAVGCSPPLAAAVVRGLRPEPAERFATIEEWHSSFAAVLPAGARASAVTDAPAVVAPTRTKQPTSSRWIRLAVGFLAGLVVASGVWWWVDSAGSSGPGTTVTQLGDGRVRVAADEGRIDVAVEGPESVVVGEQAAFEAVAPDAVSLRWITPDGSVRDDETLLLEAARPGEGRVSLMATANDGNTVTVEHVFEVVE